jgi:hypothetical protein
MKKENLGMRLRNEVLVASLYVEKMTSTFLAKILGIEDVKNSRLLGNKSGCLSFNQKVDLLIELGAISVKDRNKFQAFMEIRNQFMHNLSASTYEKCFSFTNGTDRFLLKTYPQLKTLSKEEALRNSAGELIDDIVNLTVNIIDKIGDKLHKETELDVVKKSQEAFSQAISIPINEINDYVKNEVEKNHTTNADWLKDFDKEISKILLKRWRDIFDRLTEI